MNGGDMPEKLDPTYIGLGIALGVPMGVAVGLAIGAGLTAHKKRSKDQ